MNSITLNILASDFSESDFTNSKDCALTRAVKRVNPQFLTESKGFVVNDKFVAYPPELMEKVRRMYHSIPEYIKKHANKQTIPIDAADFTVTLWY